MKKQLLLTIIFSIICLSSAKAISLDSSNVNSNIWQETRNLPTDLYAVNANLSHRIYGIAKSVWKAIGLEDAEIDDDEEKILREGAIFFVLFAILFVWMAFQSLTSLKK
jgi:hypothetical protein